MNYKEQFSACYQYFSQVKAQGPDLVKRIEPYIYNQYVEKVLHFLDDKPFHQWLKQNYAHHQRMKLLRLACDYYSQRMRHEDPATIALYAARAILAMVTEGVVSTCIEGLEAAAVKMNPDGTKYLAIVIKPPIRAAGASALGILLLSLIRLSLDNGYQYKVTDAQLARYMAEVSQYCRLHPQVVNPTNQQIRQLMPRLPLCIDGTASDQLVESSREVQGVDTPYLRGGANLAIIAPFFVKYKKTIKYAKLFDLDYGWLKQICQKKGKAVSTTADVADTGPIRTAINWGSETYLSVAVAGRPIFSTHRWGGFRLRVGRSRNTGLGTQGLHPVTIQLLEFLNVGSQMMISGPSKANSIAPVSDLETPSILLRNRDFVRVTAQNIKFVLKNYDRVYDLGQLLVSYGDFLQSNAIIPRCDYSMEQWRRDYGVHEATIPAHGQGAVNYALTHDIMIPPAHTPLINLLTWAGYQQVRNHLLNSNRYDQQIAQILRTIVIHYRVVANAFQFDSPTLVAEIFLLRHTMVQQTGVYQTIRACSALRFGLRGFPCIGGRLASVEACAISTVKPGLSLVYDVRNLTKSHINQLQSALASGHSQRVSAVQLLCRRCQIISCQQFCLACNQRTVLYEETPISTTHQIAHDLLLASKYLGVSLAGLKIKVSNQHLDRLPYWEPFEKGILRAKHGLLVFKDGTIRYSVSNLALTHFKPAQVHAPIDRLHAMGYTVDQRGDPLRSPQQVCVLKPHDVVLNQQICHTFLKATKFIDELLVRYYHRQPYYQCKTITDLIGHLVVGLAPHVLNAIAGRIVGYTIHQVVYAHPLWHAAKRRNADGDKDAVMLLADVYLNYSTIFLKKGTGGLMNVPFFISSLALTSQVDGEARNVETCKQYPAMLYQAPGSLAWQYPVTTFKQVPDYQQQTYHYQYSTPTDTIVLPTKYNAYKNLNTMAEKIAEQLALCKRLKSVDYERVIRDLFRSHLLRDIRGNTRKLYKQNYRCTKCSTTYPTIPLDGMCQYCRVPVNFTIHVASASKYRAIVLKFLEHDYLRQLDQPLYDQTSLILLQLQRILVLGSKPSSPLLKYR